MNLLCARSTRGVKLKCETNGGAHISGLTPGQHSSKRKRRSGDEPMVTLCSI